MIHWTWVAVACWVAFMAGFMLAAVMSVNGPDDQ